MHTHDSLLEVHPGKPVALDIGLCRPVCCHAGEAIQVNVAGFDYLGITGAWDDAITFNKGRHFVRTGGTFDSYLLYPEIPL